MSRAEQLLRQHISSAVTSRRISPIAAARHLSDLIKKNHPNKALALRVGLKMQAEQDLSITSFR